MPPVPASCLRGVSSSRGSRGRIRVGLALARCPSFCSLNNRGPVVATVAAFPGNVPVEPLNGSSGECKCAPRPDLAAAFAHGPGKRDAVIKRARGDKFPDDLARRDFVTPRPRFSVVNPLASAAQSVEVPPLNGTTRQRSAPCAWFFVYTVFSVLNYNCA